jgi:hypothetical protein
VSPLLTGGMGALIVVLAALAGTLAWLLRGSVANTAEAQQQIADRDAATKALQIASESTAGALLEATRENRELRRELGTREIRLAGHVTWRDGALTAEGEVIVRFAMDGGVIVGAVVKEGYSTWRAYARVQSAIATPPEPGNVQSSAITGPQARAVQEVERLLRELASFERERSARAGVK